MTRHVAVLLALGCACAPTATPAPPPQPAATQAPPPPRPQESPPPAPETGEPPEADDLLRSKLNTVVPAEYRCPVGVEAVLSDERYRGSPNTPSHQAWVAGLSPEDYDMYIGESHADSYRECTYRVRVNGSAWRYVETFDTLLSDLPESWCQDARAHVEAAIQRTTHGCTELHRGAYYGSDLVALP